MADKPKLSVFEAVKFLKDCFDEHAEKDGEKATMTKSELADMLHQQFDIVSKKYSQYCPSGGNVSQMVIFFSLLLYQTENHLVTQFFNDMDKEKDDKITFEEYMGYLAHLFKGF